MNTSILVKFESAFSTARKVWAGVRRCFALQRFSSSCQLHPSLLDWRWSISHFKIWESIAENLPNLRFGNFSSMVIIPNKISCAEFQTKICLCTKSSIGDLFQWEPRRNWPIFSSFVRHSGFRPCRWAASKVGFCSKTFTPSICKGLSSVGPKSRGLGTTLVHSTCMDLLESLGSLQDFGSGRRKEALICGDTSSRLGTCQFCVSTLHSSVSSGLSG